MIKGYNYFGRHRKAIFVLAVLIVIGGTVTYIKTKKQSTLERVSFSIADPRARQEQLKKLQQDTDNDNLRDWEEMLYHSNPQKSDTDGDGTPDGEEVKTGRDPIVSNTSKDTLRPSDLMATSTLLQDAGQDGQTQNLTKQLAARIGKEIIVRRIANPDIPFDPQSAGQDLVDQFTSSISADIPMVLTEKDIIVGRDNTTAAVKAYDTSLKNIVTANFKGLYVKPDVQIFSEAMDSQDYAKLQALDPYLAGYEAAIHQLKKLAAPPRLADLHLEYLNLAIAQENTIRKMRGAGDDPVAGLMALKQYAAIQERFQTLFDKLGAEIKKAGT